MSSKSDSVLRGKLVVYIVTFLMGGCGIAYEYTFSKVASDFLGNSVQQWAIIIGLMMLCMGIGADVQKYIKDEKLFDRFILLELFLGLVGGFGPLILLWVFGKNRDYFALIQYSLTIAVGLFIGLEIPLLSRINERYAPQLRLNIGGILRMDYIGAFIGALVWVFVLPKFFTLMETAIVLGLINNAVSLVALIYFRDLTRRKTVLGSLLALSLIILALGFTRVENWTTAAEQYLFANKIVFSTTTRYQHIVITSHSSGDVACYINGHLQFHSADEAIYHEFLVHPAMLTAPHKKRVLVLGGGDGLAVREIRKYDEVESITLVDLDPEMTRLAKENPYISTINKGSLRDSRLSIVNNGALQPTEPESLYVFNQVRPLSPEFHPVGEISVVNMDAFQYLDQIKGIYDVIIIDFPDPNSLELSKLYSQGFYKKLYHKLSRTGIIVQQSSSPVFTERAFSCIGTTIRSAGFSALPFHENVPSFGEWGWWIAGKSDIYSEKALREAITSIDTISVPVEYITPNLIHGSLNFGKNVLKRHSDPANTILNNVIHEYYISELKFYE